MIPRSFTLQNAVRIVLHAISSSAGRHYRYITPVMSFVSEQYVKVYVRVNYSRVESTKTPVNHSMVFKCTECPNEHSNPLMVLATEENSPSPVMVNTLKLKKTQCEECGGDLAITGPIWGAQTICYDLAARLWNLLNSSSFSLPLNSYTIILAMLHTMNAERTLGFDPTTISFVDFNIFFQAAPGPNKMILGSALRNAGFKLVRSYNQRYVWKTNAPRSYIFDIFRAWRKMVYREKFFENVEKDSPLSKCLKNPSKPVSFNRPKNVVEENEPQLFFTSQSPKLTSYKNLVPKYPKKPVNVTNSDQKATSAIEESEENEKLYSDQQPLESKEQLQGYLVFNLSLFAIMFGVLYLSCASLPKVCLLYTSPSPRDGLLSRMPSSA
eukprot:TRINITY_DN2460_c0_g2_i2.p1 TRINITY_DN2460_c0_g2~~TRINITY_DN2460_c0_g2_i2.p1  ORF type:complete len:382 (-),score=48.07 TRINITY_DN2460_c0_g2_i2:16-1161(-)